MSAKILASAANNIIESFLLDRAQLMVLQVFIAVFL
jgi:hypothetical protein